MSFVVYMKNFIKDKYVSSVIPTSPFGVKKVCSKIDFKKSRVIVEYGAGTGVFTKYLLEHMRSDTRLIVIERNPNFVSILRKRFSDPRLSIFNGSAEKVFQTLEACNALPADYVISGIPFIWLSEEQKDRILRDTYRVLKDGGKFLAYQTCFQTSQHLMVYLDQVFHPVQSKYEVRNVPPLRIYEAVKGN